MRLFIAINFSRVFKDRMAELLLGLSQLPVKVKWVLPENIHLTLKFLGEVNPDRLEEISDAMRRACQGIKPWDLDIKGMGVFPNWRFPRVIWVGVDNGASLVKLQQNITREYMPLGFPADRFTPHLTLGRLRPGVPAGPLQDKLQMLADTFWGKEKVEAVSLMESCLSSRGASYMPILTLKLE